MPTDPGPSPGRIRFGDFELDVRAHQLRHRGRAVRLQEKSFLVLRALLDRPAEVVTREELAAVLWPKERFVDVEHGLNTAVRRLRAALGDSADDPHYVETLPRVGYRFVAASEPVAVDGAATSRATRQAEARETPPTPAPRASTPAEPSPRRPRRRAIAAAATMLVAAGAIAALRWRPGAEAGATAVAPRAAGTEVVAELLARARYLRNTKRSGEAKRFVEQALQLEPDNADALAGLALANLGEGRHDAAREYARRALELDPEAWEAHRTLGSIAVAAGNLGEAEGHFRRSVAANPLDHKSRNRLARHLLASGRLDEAREQMLESRRLAPDDPDVQNIWIGYAVLSGDYEDAIRRGEMWMAIWGSHVRKSSVDLVRQSLALAYLGARRHDEALAQMRQVAPDDELRVALVAAHAGRAREAREILNRHEQMAARGNGAPAAELPPARAQAPPSTAWSRSDEMAQVAVLLGDFDRAFAHLDRGVAARSFPDWLNVPLFHGVRQDPRWPGFAARLEREFFGPGAAAPRAAPAR